MFLWLALTFLKPLVYYNYASDKFMKQAAFMDYQELKMPLRMMSVEIRTYFSPAIEF